MTSIETIVNIEFVQSPHLRDAHSPLQPLGHSIRDDGQRRPICLWSDGTLLSGSRRLRAQFLMAGAPEGGRFRKIKAVFVDTIEDAAKHILADNEDKELILPWKGSELGRLLELMRRLDAPAAIKRADAARRDGVRLRRLTFEGRRNPGRVRNHDHVLSNLGPAFGMSETTAKRLWAVHSLATGLRNATQEEADAARAALRAIDDGTASISAAYQRLMDGKTNRPRMPPTLVPITRSDPEPPASAAARQQLTAWEKALPALAGITSGLAALGPPNPELTWDQVGPVNAQLAAVRRELEKIIKQMRETIKP